MIRSCISCPWHDYIKESSWDVVHECQRNYNRDTSAINLYKRCTLEDFPETLIDYLKIKHGGENGYCL